MRRWVVMALALAACGGKDDDTSESTEECTTVTVTVTVVNEAGDPVTDATVEVGEGSCAEGADGVYTCAQPPGEYVMSIVKTPDHNPYAETLFLDGVLCEYPVSVTLPPALVY
jgi:hypothetical protein